MDVRDLTYFEAIVAEGRLGAAADRLHRTKPALTKCLRRLEAEVGGPLFSRQGRDAVLTPVGERLLAHARFLRTALSDASRDVADVAKGHRGHLRIGMGATIADYLLPRLADWSLSMAPGWTMSLQLGLGDQLRASLADGQLDGIVTTALPRDADDFVVQDWISDEVVVVARPGHPVLAREPALGDLAPYRWVLPGKDVASRNWLDWTLESHGQPRTDVQVEVRSVQLIPAFVSRSDLLSFLPRQNLQPSGMGSELVEVSIPALTMKRTLRLLHRRSGFLLPALERLSSFLRCTELERSATQQHG